jgi:hypothetical protein
VDSGRRPDRRDGTGPTTSIWARLVVDEVEPRSSRVDVTREAVVGAAIVGRLLHSSIVGGRDPSPGRTFLREIDTWRGRGWPGRWPRPRPNGWDDGLMFAGAGRYAAHLAAHHTDDPDMRVALGQAAERLLGEN